MKLNRSLASVLGIIGALTVPAAVFAQFQPQQRLTANSLNDLAERTVQLGETQSTLFISSDPSTGGFTTTTYRAQGDGVVTLYSSGPAVVRTNITAGLEIAGAVRTVWRQTGGSGATLTVRNGQRFSVGGAVASGGALDSSINIAWTPLTADADPPVIAN